MGEFNKIKYMNDYQRQHYTRVTLGISNEEQEVIEHLKSQPSMTAYVVELIKADMEKKREE